MVTYSENVSELLPFQGKCPVFLSLIGKTNAILHCFPYRNVLGNKGRKLEFHVLVSPLEVPEETFLCSGGGRALVIDGDRKTDLDLRK